LFLLTNQEASTDKIAVLRITMQDWLPQESHKVRATSRIPFAGLFYAAKTYGSST